MTSSTSASEQGGSSRLLLHLACAAALVALALAALWRLGRPLEDPWQGATPLEEPPRSADEIVILGNSIAAANLDPAALHGRRASLQGSQSWHWAAIAQHLRTAPWSTQDVVLCAPLLQLATARPPDTAERALLAALLPDTSVPPPALAAAAGGRPHVQRLHRGRLRLREGVLDALFTALPRASDRMSELEDVRTAQSWLPRSQSTQVALPSTTGTPGRAGRPADREGARVPVEQSALPLIVDAVGAARLTILLPPVSPDERGAQPCAVNPREARVAAWLEAAGVRVLDARAAPVPSSDFRTRHHLRPDAAQRFTATVAQALRAGDPSGLGACAALRPAPSGRSRSP